MHFHLEMCVFFCNFVGFLRERMRKERKRNKTIMYKNFIKRILDLCIAFVGVVLASPILLLFTILLHFANKGAGAFFTQERPGKDGKIFRVIKFKTMNDERGADGELLPDVERLTKIGRITRALSIDELPQLLNILFGDMSIVGPRPERIENVFEYSQMYPEFELRHKVKAGLTGLAQLYGKYNTRPEDKLHMDLTYIEDYSLLLDLKLVILTFKILFMKESTEGFEKDASNVLKRDNDSENSKEKENEN